MGVFDYLQSHAGLRAMACAGLLAVAISRPDCFSVQYLTGLVIGLLTGIIAPVPEPPGVALPKPPLPAPGVS